MMHSRVQLTSAVKVNFLMTSHFGYCTWFQVKLQIHQGGLINQADLNFK